MPSTTRPVGAGGAGGSGGGGGGVTGLDTTVTEPAASSSSLPMFSEPGSPCVLPGTCWCPSTPTYASHCARLSRTPLAPYDSGYGRQSTDVTSGMPAASEMTRSSPAR
ncbi:hypothetical protein DDP54_15505 (plasmid) [Cellulomonas sp. WB94]|nr:hypothetical protein DDP54_15505 [Cellulomonas sp. WB94]